MIEQICDPEIEWIEAPARVDAQMYRGLAGVRESLERWLDGFEDYGVELERVVDCGDQVLAVVT
jgi:SnoaL-like protein